MKEFRERRIMLVTRIALFFVGAFVGAIAMWQTLDVIEFEFPSTIAVLCYLAAICLVGGTLFLSAPPIRKSFHAFAAAVRKKFSSVKAIDIAGTIIGLLAGLSVMILSDFMMQDFLKIWAIRVVIDAGLGLLTALLVAFLVSGYVSPAMPEPMGDTILEVSRGTKGYLLTEAALSDHRIIALCSRWLDGNIFVLSRTADMLASRGEEEELPAYANFKALYNARKLRILESLSTDVLEIAEQKRLKVITAPADRGLCELKKGVTILVIGELGKEANARNG